LSVDERSAVEDGIAALGQLTEKLVDTAARTDRLLDNWFK
jgi:hypothetical protein